MHARLILGALVSLGVVPCAARGTGEGDPLKIPTLDDLAPPKPHKLVLYPELPGEEEPGMHSPDLTELILIAGHADGDGGLNQNTLDFLKTEAGWEPIMDVRHYEEPARCYYDHVWAWKKGTHCIAAWSATDDMRDFILQGSGVDMVKMEPNTTSYCGWDVNAFVVSEMEGFRRSPEWPAFVDFFQGEQCETVASIGHSLGGAMATLFAGCANVGAEGFGNRTDFGLVTFGTYPISKKSIYSGKPGTPFVGTRYHVSAHTGDSNVRETKPVSPKQYRLDILILCSELAALAGLEKVSKLINSQVVVIRNMFEPQVDTYWVSTGIDKVLKPFMTIFKLFQAGVVPYGLPANITGDMIAEGRTMYTTFLRKIIARGDAFFDFDPISAHNQIYGYQHALVDFQPITNRMYGSALLPRVPAVKGVHQPVVDHFRALFGLHSTGKLPNHYNCCYYRGKNCPYFWSKTAVPYKACATTMPR